ncbi:hypothetical protein AaE_008789 [Aphanomyces astaci]|uniref:RGS domain-containing protein n=1 Tax=Aphanomyces astaci TaxID=112090 RepID=A0A6A4ZYZ3_APHAT|nr:hypothetical protein AaE_008789 [Aphanomyces astaci]
MTIADVCAYMRGVCVQKCLQKHPTFHPRVAAKAIFKDFLKSQQVKCTTVAMRNRIRASLRSDASDPVDVFESAETLVFNSLYSSVFLAFLDTPEGTRWHADAHGNMHR